MRVARPDSDNITGKVTALPESALERFHLFRRMPSLVRGGTISSATGADNGTVSWVGADGTERVVDVNTGVVGTAPKKDDKAPSPTGTADAAALLAKGTPSQDGLMLVKVVEHNLVLTDVASGVDRALTTEGTAARPWQSHQFTADSRRIVAAQADLTEQPLYPLTDWLTFPCEVTPVPHSPEIAPPPPPARLAFIDVATDEVTWVAERGRCNIIPLRTSDDGRWLLAVGYDQVNTIELLRIDTSSGEITALMSDHVVNCVPYLYAAAFAAFAKVPGFEGALWASDRDGDLRLYAVPADGASPWPITPSGVQLSMPVDQSAPATVLPAGDNVILMALTDPQRPYDVHACLTNLASDFRLLTTEPGVHAIAPAPGAEAFLDRHSSHGRPPQTDLWRFDGSFVATLEVADVVEAEAAGREAPEEFVVKADDGITDLHGLLYKPAGFDPNGRYPLVDIVYGGPQQIAHTGSYVSFAAGYSPWTDWSGLAAAFTRLGFVGLVLDGRGTPGRGRAFQDAAGHDFPSMTAKDHAAAIRGLAGERPWIDTGRCGVLGHSFGGYHAVRCGLAEPEIFKAVVAAAGAFEPALQDRSFAEGLFGVSYQADPDTYTEAGMSAHAKEFLPELMIIAGTHDTNVLLVQAMQFSDALVKAGKQHDLVLLQNKDHALDGVHGDYALERAARFLWQHLQEA